MLYWDNMLHQHQIKALILYRPWPLDHNGVSLVSDRSSQWAQQNGQQSIGTRAVG